MIPIFQWIFRKFAKESGEEVFDGAKHPIVLFSAVNSRVLFVSDPTVTQQFMTTHNSCIDKDELFAALIRPLWGNVFVFKKASDTYKAQKKHASLAFLKEKMRLIMENFKRVTQDTCE